MEQSLESQKAPEIVYVYVNKVYQSQRDGYKRYYQRNAETIKEKQREYHKNRYNSDPEYKAKKLEQAKQRRALKKEQEASTKTEEACDSVAVRSSKPTVDIEAIREKNREYHKNRYNNDPEYKAKKLEQAKQRRALKKEQEAATKIEEAYDSDAVREKKREYQKNKYHTDLEFKAMKVEQARQRRALKKAQKDALEASSFLHPSLS